MRARNIKPGFWLNADLVDLPFSTRLLFIGLWMLADRLGRLLDKPRQIKMAIFPADDVDVDEALWLLYREGFIVRYVKYHAQYIQINEFSKHQNPHRNEAKSVIPGCQDEGCLPVDIPVWLRQGHTKASARPADSLIPDSLIQRNDNRSSPGPVDNFSGGSPPPAVVVSGHNVPKVNGKHPPAAETVGELIAVLQANGVEVGEREAAAVRMWVADLGVSIEAAMSALTQAEEQRAAQGSSQPVNVGLLSAILTAAKPSPRVVAVDWGQVGFNRGITPRPGESMADYRERVRATLDSQPSA